MFDIMVQRYIVNEHTHTNKQTFLKAGLCGSCTGASRCCLCFVVSEANNNACFTLQNLLNRLIRR